MKLKGHLLRAFLIGLVSLIGFSCMAILISAQKIVLFDQTLISFIQGFESQTLTSIMKLFTFIGSFPVILVLFFIVSFILYFVLRSRAEVFLLGTVILGTQVINRDLKIFFHRDRPNFHLLINESGYSFPSGHAMSAFAVYGILTFIFWRHIPNRFGRTALVLFSSLLILIIGTSRIYLGVHYPSDIIGGYFASSIWLTVSIWFFQWYKEKKYKRTNLDKNKGLN